MCCGHKTCPVATRHVFWPQDMCADRIWPRHPPGARHKIWFRMPMSTNGIDACALDFSWSNQAPPKKRSKELSSAEFCFWALGSKREVLIGAETAQRKVLMFECLYLSEAKNSLVNSVDVVTSGSNWSKILSNGQFCCLNVCICREDRTVSCKKTSEKYFNSSRST